MTDLAIPDQSLVEVIRFEDPELIRVLEEQARLETGEVIPLGEMERIEEIGPNVSTKRSHASWQEANSRRIAVITALRGGASVKEAIAGAGVQYTTYLSWRQRYPVFAAQADAAKLASEVGGDMVWNGTRASFHATFFGHSPTWFQLLAIREMVEMRRGNILMALWPPEFGKTTTFEDHANCQLALDPAWRFFLGSESRDIAAKILARVKARMDPMGPTPEYVKRWGPFMPQPGHHRSAQPWGEYKMNVFKARHSDERDSSMRAVGVGSKQTVSTRTDHAHLDDLQSSTTLAQTDKVETWVRQDVLSRPGEDGITTIFGTRVGDDDVLERLEDDEDLDGSILKVLKFPAIIVDQGTQEVRSLWPEKWPLEKLERQKKKVGAEAFDRNYMQAPGLSKKGKGTFNADTVDSCKDPAISLLHRAPAGSIIYVGLDPAIGGRNCVLAVEATPEGRLVIRRIMEKLELVNNAQVIAELADTIEYVEQSGATVTDVVIEAMAFQKGLMHDESLLDLRNAHRFSVTDHLTGWNKYDPDIGIPSMVESFNRKEIVLPWASDDYTRAQIGELRRQLLRWKPGQRGNKHRMDMVMALWFSWIIWRGRWKQPATQRSGHDGFRRRALPYAPTQSGLLVPTQR